MSTPAAKRRRIDAASTLSKPFRSPFKTPFKSPLKTVPPATTQSNVPTPLKTSFSNENELPVLSDKPPNLPSSTPNRARAKKTFSCPVSAAVLNADPAIAPLLKAQRELERQLKEVKEELEQAEQARKIERDSRKTDPDAEIDGELLVLVDKWKGASRLAAEELFGKVRDRVNRFALLSRKKLNGG
jgi:Swi5-dependent recombination DNA repair protein 1